MNHKLGGKITGDSTSYSYSLKYEVDNIPIFFVVQFILSPQIIELISKIRSKILLLKWQTHFTY